MLSLLQTIVPSNADTSTLDSTHHRFCAGVMLPDTATKYGPVSGVSYIAVDCKILRANSSIVPIVV